MDINGAVSNALDQFLKSLSMLWAWKTSQRKPIGHVALSADFVPNPATIAKMSLDEREMRGAGHGNRAPYFVNRKQ